MPTEVECPTCKGEGHVPCECVECGAQHLRECRTCHGFGVVTPPFRLDDDVDEQDTPEPT